MAPYVNFTTLLTSRKNELADLPNKDSPVLHLHLYCHSLSGTLSGDQELKLLVSDRGCALKTLDIFAAQLPSFKRLVLVGSKDPVEFRLYYDVESGPASFWLARSGDAPLSVHVLREESGCFDRETPPCAGVQHFDLTAEDGAGIRWQGSNPLESIPSVCWDELRPPRLVEFETFGEHIRRLQNLPRLLDDLFNAAGEELMGQRPKTTDIMAKLRMVILCARAAPNLTGLVAEAQTLLTRLGLPAGFPALASGKKPFDDCFFVPDKVPRTLESVMDVPMNNLLAISRRLESKTEMQSLRALIREQGNGLMASIRSAVGSTIPEARLDSEARHAADTTETVMDKMDDLRRYRRELETAKAAFDQGLQEFQKKQDDKLEWEIVKAVAEVGISVGIVVYTGGAGAPLTVGAVNKVLSKASVANTDPLLTWLANAVHTNPDDRPDQRGNPAQRSRQGAGKALIKVHPKVNAALKNHAQFSSIGSDADQRGTKLAERLKKTASTISDSLLAGRAGERVDYLGLMADWREMDMRTDSAFAVIKEEISAGEYVAGLDDYRLAMKSLAIRGETLVAALKDAYDARTSFLVLVAESKAKTAALAEIKTLHDRVLADASQEAVAFLPIQQRLVAELAQRRRVVFNMLHQGVLALIYQSNDVKLQKTRFGGLSPALTADQLADQWEAFKRATIDGKQPQSRDVAVGAGDALPAAWRGLLARDLATPFQIPPTLRALQSQHHMRIRGIRAEFVGLARVDGSVAGADALEYTLWLGPLMIDRATPYASAPATKGTTVQYYMEAHALAKTGASNELVDDRGDYAKRAVCCSGRLVFNRADVVDAGWDLTTVTDVKLHVKYETLFFPAER
ncbi:hypothetical protein B0T24DRAFT_669810 [Lasiosphaeria ovina]|uniref:Uncharacterized protein n=1 Tax=Lasiosphaeria ovina TaxID=92902 RepID=A0AAE0JWX8_9PEZI|nr:hypothetical protein B0T24DRAFT_669810 [Lasiosphaeria ovina]